MTSPTIVLVHGAFADASTWSATYDELKGDGLPIFAPAGPLRGLAHDAAYLSSFLDQVEGDVVLVGHSYGGAVISIAGHHDKVKALVYVAAYALEEGESLGGFQGGFPDSELATALKFAPLPDGGTDVTVDVEKFPDVFARDVPRELTEFLAHSQRPLAAAAFEEPAPAPAWKDKPSYGLVPAADTTINPDVHRFGFQRAGMTTIEVEGASHGVLLSQPKVVADFIRRAVAAL
jgi:pimeloyl-ACP methyl ester carboxylesterase